MMRATITLASLSLALALAACEPVIVTPGAGDVLPVEAQRVIDQATATAGAQATEDARATATDISARQTSTAAYQGTLEALEARQTEAGLTITQQAAQAEFTQQASQNTEEYRASQAAATPTALAARQQATAAAADYARQATAAADVAEFWASVRFIVLALLIVGGLAAICVAAIGAATRIKLAEQAAQAEIAKAAFRVLAPSHWAEYTPGDGYQVYPLPGLLDEPVTVIENVPTQPDRLAAWRQSVRLFAWWADRYGYGLRDLGPAGAGVVSDPDWRKLSKILKSAGVLAEVALPGEKGRVTAWAPEWNYTRLAHELSHGPLALAYPAEGDTPKVRFTVPNTTPQNGPHNTATQKG